MIATGEEKEEEVKELRKHYWINPSRSRSACPSNGNYYLRCSNPDFYTDK
jgi:hypothetical protein